MKQAAAAHQNDINPMGMSEALDENTKDDAPIIKKLEWRDATGENVIDEIGHILGLGHFSYDESETKKRRYLNSQIEVHNLTLTKIESIEDNQHLKVGGGQRLYVPNY